MANGMIMGDYQIISSGNHVLKQKMQLFFGTGVCKDTLQSNTAMIRLTPLRKRPALSALVLLLMGSGFCQAQEMLTDSARKEASEWLKEVKAGYLTTSSSRILKAVAARSARMGALHFEVEGTGEALGPVARARRGLHRVALRQCLAHIAEPRTG